MTSDLGPCNTTRALWVEAEDIVLDCGGYTIYGNGTNIGVSNTAIHKSNITIKNCNFNDFEYAVYLSGARNATVSSNDAYNCSQACFYLLSTRDSILVSNTATNSATGFRLENAFNNFLYINTANNNALGFYLANSDENDVSGNDADDNYEAGLALQGSDLNTVSANTAYNSGSKGVWLIASRNNTVASNKVSGGSSPDGAGFYLLHGSSNNTLTGNIAFDSDGPAFLLEFSSNYNTLTDNKAYLSYQGFKSASSSFNSFTGNDAYNNAPSHGFVFVNSDHNNLSDNTAENNALYGFYIDNADNNTFVSNAAQNNSRGFLFVGSANSNLTSNNASLNDVGFYVSSGCSGTTMTSNIAKDNGQGFIFSGCSGNTVSNNTVHDNTNYGFQIHIANITMSGDHLYGNGNDLYIRRSSNLQLSNVVIDSSGGDNIDYTEFSLTDSTGSVEGYKISWAADPGAPDAYHVDIANKFLDIIQAEGTVSIDSLTFHWLDSEAGTYNESRFELWQKEGTIWRQLNATPVPSANTITTVNLNQFGTTGLFHSITPPDSDGDGVPDDEDDCPDTYGDPEFNGCPYADEVYVRLIVHVHPQAPQAPYTECQEGENHCELNLSGVDVRVYNKTDPGFMALWGAPQKTEYPDIFEDDTGLIGSCTSDENGLCVVGEVAPGDYLVLGKYYDAAVPATVYTGASKAPEDFVDGLATKDLVLQKMYKKNGDIQYQGGQVIVIGGSFLEIVAPLMTYWEGTEELYPFYFKSDSDWTADVCLEMPSGYVIKGTFDENGNLVPGDCKQTFVAGESMTIIFAVEDVGSPPPHAKAKIKAKGPKGGVHNVEFEIPGLSVAAEKAGDKAKGKPFQELQELPLPVLLLLAVIAILVAAALFTQMKKE